MTFGAAANIVLGIDEIGIGIARGRFGGHAGIAFHSAKDGLQLVHLRWHKSLAVEAYPPQEDCWIVCKPEIPPLARKQLVGIVRAIAKRKPQISYALDCIAGKGSFDANGHYRPPKGSYGLTCATFVTEVFRASRMPLVKEATWQKTDENIKWANDVIALLESKGVDADHIKAVKASVNGLRMRPEEVGAAGVVPFKERPVDFDVASRGGIEVMEVLDRTCASPPAVPPFGAVVAQRA